MFSERIMKNCKWGERFWTKMDTFWFQQVPCEFCFLLRPWYEVFGQAACPILVECSLVFTQCADALNCPATEWLQIKEKGPETCYNSS